jgi:hypothetical protein
MRPAMSAEGLEPVAVPQDVGPVLGTADPTAGRPESRIPGILRVRWVGCVSQYAQ